MSVVSQSHVKRYLIVNPYNDPNHAEHNGLISESYQVSVSGFGVLPIVSEYN